MKANIENLKKVLKLCAEAHNNCEFADWEEEGQLGIKSESVPLVADVKMILDAFFGAGTHDISVEWGYTTIWLGEEFLDEVNEYALNLALPHDWKYRLAA